MEDPKPLPTQQETSENNNIDFKNVLNGSVLSNLSKTLDMALLENSMAVESDDKLVDSSNTCSIDNRKEVLETPQTIATEEGLSQLQTSLMQEEKIPECSVPSNNYDNSQASIPCNNSLSSVSGDEGKAISNETTGRIPKQSSSCPASEISNKGTSGELLEDMTEAKQTTDSSASEKLVTQIADTEQTSDFASSKKLLTDIAEPELITGSSNMVIPDTTDLEPNLASSFSFETSLSNTAELKQTSVSKREPTTELPSLDLTNTKDTPSAACSSNGLIAEMSSSGTSLPSSSGLGSTSSSLPLSSNCASDPNSLSFLSDTVELESSGDSSDYEDAFDWDLSGNIEYYDFKDREKVKLKQSGTRELDSGNTSKLDFSSEMSQMETSSPLKRKRKSNYDERAEGNLSNPSRVGLRSGKRSKSSEVGNFLHVSGRSKITAYSSTLNDRSNSIDWILPSTSSSSQAVSVSKAPSTSMFKAPALVKRVSKPMAGTLSSRLSKPIPSSNSRISIIPKPTPPTSLANTGSSPPVTGTVLQTRKGSDNIVASSSKNSTNTASLLPTGGTKPNSPSSTSSSIITTASSSSSSSSGPDTVSVQPNRARLRKVYMEALGQHRRTRLLKTRQFATSRKKILEDLMTQLYTLQAHCVQGRM